MTLSVLIAEPSRTLASLMRLSLGPLGGELRVASDGREALTLARQRLPDLVVADAALQALDGYALAASIRRMPGGAEVPILLTLPDHALPDAERLAYVGVSDVLHKPFERAALLERVRALLERRPGSHSEGPPSSAPWDSPSASQSMPHGYSPTFSDPALAAPPRVNPAPPWGNPAPPWGNPTPKYGQPPATRLPAPDLEELVDQAVQERLTALVDAKVEALVTAQLDSRVEAVVAETVAGALPPLLEQILPGLLTTLAEERLAELVNAGLPRAVVGLAKDAVRDAAESAVAQRMPDVMEYAAFGLGPKVESVLRELLPSGIRDIADKVVWKVVPEIAEDLIREEIRRLTEAPEEDS